MPAAPRGTRTVRAGTRAAALTVTAVFLVGCATSKPLPTLQPLPGGGPTQAGVGAAAATPKPTEPDPLGPGLGLPSPGASLPAPIVIEPPEMAPPLWLTRTDTGGVFQWSAMRDTPTIVYFGYTHCPDVCPASLGVIREAVAEAGVPVQVVFITVDPARDTPDVLKEYLGYFGQGWIGLMGSDAQTHQAIELYGGRYQTLDTTSASGYAVGHTTDIYLIDKQGTWVETFPFGSSSDQVITGLRAISGV